VQDGAGANTAANPTAGTTFSDTATCTGGKVVLGGGGQVNATAQRERTSMLESYASSSTVWTVLGIVTVNMTGSNTAHATAYALCGNP
jgi:predicted flavoprotein YhiN